MKKPMINRNHVRGNAGTLGDALLGKSKISITEKMEEKKTIMKNKNGQSLEEMKEKIEGKRKEHPEKKIDKTQIDEVVKKISELAEKSGGDFTLSKGKDHITVTVTFERH